MLERPSKRIFASLPETLDGTAALPCAITLMDAERVHYLTNVVRVKRGESLFLVDEARTLGAETVIKEIQRNQLVLEVLSVHPAPPEAGPQVVLAAALIKEQRWDWLLQKVTELGVSEIIPLLSQRVSVPQADWSKKHKRWYGVLQSASEQSERWQAPGLALPEILPNWLESSVVQDAKHKLFLLERHVDARVSLKTYLSENAVTSGRVLAAVGPEGGWTDTEVALFLKAGWTPVSLGQGILRSETAAIQLMGVVNYETMDLP